MPGQLLLILLLGCCQSSQPKSGCEERHVLRTEETRRATDYRFSAADDALLDQVQRATFQYFWKEVGQPAALVKDRLKAPVSSVAAVGFQLSSLPIGIERNWIAREQGRERALTVLRSLIGRNDNRYRGIYLHFVDLDTGGLSESGYEVLASTVDTALLLAGAITAGEYFGGEVRQLTDRMVAEADWRAFTKGPEGFISMGWAPRDKSRMAPPGQLHRFSWHIASDEELLVYFLAVGTPATEHSVDPRLYYRLKRELRRYEDGPAFVVSYQGALFQHFFSHCWIDFRRLGADNPARFGMSGPRVDWFENSRRAVLNQRERCIDQADRFKTFGPDRWGLSACAARDGYIVPEVRPNLIQKDRWYDGTVAPYAAGASIMFTPMESVAALRAFRSLTDEVGKPFVWRDPTTGGYGFVDSFNLDQGFASDDYVGIDQGPLLLGIENARTDLIWKLFMKSETAQRAVSRLKIGGG